MRHGAQFVKHVVPAVVKPARVLWNEVIGFVFLCIAVICGSRAIGIYRDFASGSGHLVNVIMATGFTVLMLYFGITSFLRARKISRS